MNEKMDKVKRRIDEIKKEREELKEKYDYLVEQMKKTIDKHSQDIEFLKNEVRGIADKEEKDEEGVSDVRSLMNSIKDELNEKVNVLDKEITSELSKFKGLEERLGKDVEDFEKFASKQKSRIDEFESKVSDKIDMFAIEKENLRRDFTSISSDFKNIGSHLDSLKEKDSNLSQHLQNLSLEMENFKKATEEILEKLKGEQKIFQENVVAKLNEASNKILNRLSQSEAKTSSELVKKSEDIKLFRAHTTQFINDLVVNYEKRFEMMKSEIDEILKLVEERVRAQRAMIFE